MKRLIIIFLLLCGVAVAINNHPVFIKIHTAMKDGGYTRQQVVDANDVQIINLAGLDPNEAAVFKMYKNLIKRNIKHKIRARRAEVRRTTIAIPDLTAIIMKYKADGLTTAEAKAELLEVALEVLK